jgi:hypothetical protein
MRPAALAVSASLLAATAQAAVFEQGPVQTRDYRNPVLAREAAHPTETESLFGFTLGSDTDEAGSKSIAIESVGSFGKRGGRYSGYGSKLEFAYGLRDDLSVSLGLLGGWRDIRGVAGLSDTNAVRFDGLGTELRWRILKRQDYPVGLTLHIEPSWRAQDETSGAAGRGFSSENKLIIDRELIADRLYGAVNLIYDIETFKPRGGTWERASTAGIATAATYQVVPQVFVGGEVRYLRSYEGIAFHRLQGEAVFAGPTLFWHFGDAAFLSLAWNMQVSRPDPDNFPRHQLRLKMGVEF